MVFLRRNDLTLLVLTAVIAMALPAFAQADAKACRSAVKGLQTELVDFPSSGMANFRDGLAVNSPHTPYETVKINGLDYLTFLGESTSYDPSEPFPLFNGQQLRMHNSPEFALSGITVATEGDQFRWYVPTLETQNILLAQAFSEAGLEQLLYVNGDNDNFNTPEETYWRALSKRTILISVEALGFSSHDLVDHLPGYLLLAKEHPSAWTRATDALRKAFGYLDTNYPQLKGSIQRFAKLKGSEYLPTMLTEKLKQNQELQQIILSIPDSHTDNIVRLINAIGAVANEFELSTPGISIDGVKGQSLEDLEQRTETLELALKIIEEET